MLDIQQIFDGTFTGTPPAFTGAAITVTRVSTNVIDMLVARDMGVGGILGVNVIITTAFATLTSLAVAFQVSADNSTFVTLLTTAAIPVAQLTAGSRIFQFGLPVNQFANMTAGVLAAPGRYMRMSYTVAGSDATAGAVGAWIAPLLDRDTINTYPRNYTA